MEPVSVLLSLNVSEVNPGTSLQEVIKQVVQKELKFEPSVIANVAVVRFGKLWSQLLNKLTLYFLVQQMDAKP